MRIRFSDDLKKELTKISKKNRKLTKQIEKQLKLFASDPTHKSLRVHKLSGKLKNMWSISINKSIRIAYLLLDNNEAYFFRIGTHDEVYRE